MLVHFIWLTSLAQTLLFLLLSLLLLLQMFTDPIWYEAYMYTIGTHGAEYHFKMPNKSSQSKQ